MTQVASIQVLPKDVVDRIAAGEVVQRPVSVVKELLENSLDAKSTCVSIHVESNKITITDNGSGIAPIDLGLAATRFATSKLHSIGDLLGLESFGFRGEALASVSLVSRLSICSRTPASNIGYQQEYQDGRPVFPKPKPQARTVGTTVVVRDLFYNVPHRKSRNEREEYARVLTVVQSYAIHCASANVGLICRNKNNRVDLNSTSLLVAQKCDPTTATLQVLKHVFGSQVQFLSFSCKVEEEEGEDKKESCSYRASGFVSHPSNSATKKTTLVLFVNDRLVECAPFKRILQDMGSAMIMYLSITVPGPQVDVNVHPTKKQVTLLYQDEVLGGVERELRSLLQSTYQTFGNNSSVQGADKKRKSVSLEEEISESPPPRPRTEATAPRPSNFVRTSKAAPAGALEPYLVSTKRQQEQHHSGCPLFDIDTTQPGAFAKQCTCPLVRLTPRSIIRPKRVPPTPCTYHSIQSLRKVFTKHQKTSLKDCESLLRNAVWVGQVSPQQALVQCGVELWMWNVRELAQSLFYQLALLQFGGLVSAQLKERINVTTVMAYALELEEGHSDDDSDSNNGIGETNLELAQQAATCLMDHSEMLAEYFSIRLEREEEDIWLTALPVLLEGHEPSPGGLSVFLLRLATEVEWTLERSCFEGICRELGSYYAVSKKNVQHTLFPAISFLLSPTPRVEAFMRKMTVLSELYKAFER